MAEATKLAVPFLIGATVRLAGDRALSWWLCGAWPLAMGLAARTEASAFVAMAGAGYIALVVGMRPIPCCTASAATGIFPTGCICTRGRLRRRSSVSDRGTNAYAFLLACFAVTLGCAVLSWFIVEKPCLALKRRSLVDPTGPRA